MSPRRLPGSALARRAAGVRIGLSGIASAGTDAAGAEVRNSITEHVFVTRAMRDGISVDAAEAPAPSFIWLDLDSAVAPAPSFIRLDLDSAVAAAAPSFIHRDKGWDRRCSAVLAQRV